LGILKVPAANRRPESPMVPNPRSGMKVSII
jgi:hypothetical protein